MVEIIEFLIQSILIELTKFYYYSLKDKIIAISSDEERHCFECSAVISDGDLGLMDHLKKEHWSSEARFHGSSSIQRNVSFLSLLSFRLFLWWMYACVCSYFYFGGVGGGGRLVIPRLYL